MSVRSHAWVWLCALLLVSCCAGFASSTSDASSVAYRTETSEVRVTFFATDKGNRLVEAVEKKDFVVVDSSIVVRDFRSFARTNETAIDVVALVDTSESTASRFRAVMNNVWQMVSESASITGDKFSVVTFGGLRPAVLCSEDCRSADAGRKLLAAQSAGATPLFDALAYAASFVSRRHLPGTRPVVILFSDGYDTISLTSARYALEAVMASGATLYTVDLNRATERNPVLAEMAEATGGRAFSIDDGTGRLLETVLADQRASYVVTYQLPSRVAGFHSLRILSRHNPNLRFHCRKGYNYEAVR